MNLKKKSRLVVSLGYVYKLTNKPRLGDRIERGKGNGDQSDKGFYLC